MLHFYAIEEEGGEYIKVGVSGDVRRRLKETQTYNPRPLRLFLQYPSHRAREIEDYFLTTYRFRGEWLKDGPEVRAALARVEEEAPWPLGPDLDSEGNVRVKRRPVVWE